MYIIQKKKNLNLKFYLKKINTELLKLMTICSIHLWWYSVVYQLINVFNIPLYNSDGGNVGDEPE
jgi:hypothetical protein